jgi:putative oxidoreductase
MSIGPLALRLTIGPLFVGHGAQKLFGWFGGHGPEGTGGFFETLGLRPGKRHATVAGVAEALGGALLTVGALTPVAATMISATMITAIRKVHAPKGPWATEGGWEYNVTVIAAMVALADVGPGALSVDHNLMPRAKGPACALATLAAAAAGSYLVASDGAAAPVDDVAAAPGAEAAPASADGAGAPAPADTPTTPS